MIEKIMLLVMCHLIGDYVLQGDFIAKTKGQNWYHLLVHCGLYIVPFYICLGFIPQLALLFLTHIVVDALKARYGKINYVVDQVWHYLMLIWCLF